MYCRCRFLRAYHESLHSQKFKRPFLGSPRKHTSTRASEPSDAPFISHRPNNDTAEFPNSELDHARGSTKSPFAFKPLPPHVLDADESEPPQLLEPSKCLDFLAGNFDDQTMGKYNYGDSWTNYVQYHKFEKRQKQRADAEPFSDPEAALREWRHLQSTQRGQLTNLSALRWSLIGIAACELESAGVMSDFAHDLVEAYRNAPRVQATMVSKVLHRLLFPGGRRTPMQNHPAFEHLTRAWLPAPFIAGNPIKEKFQKNLDALVISIYKEYYTKFPETVSSLPRQLVFHLGLTAIRTHSADLLLQGSLLSVFLLKLQQNAPTTSLAFPSLTPSATVIGPSPEVFPLYRFIQQFLNEGSEKQAFQIFQKLVKTGFVSPNAVSQVRLDGADLKEIILFAMVRSCLDYEWVTGALELLLDALETPLKKPVARGKGTREVINETAFLILKQASLVSLGPTFAFTADTPPGVVKTVARRVAPGATYLFQRCLTLIIGLRKTDNDLMLDDRVIQSFYKLAHQINAGPQAEALYNIGRYKLDSRHYASTPSLIPSFFTTPAFKQSPPTPVSQLHLTNPKFLSIPSGSPHIPDTNSAHLEYGFVPDLPRYPPPKGPALTWLMAYLTTISKNVHLGRVLASEVADLGLDIPMLDRPRFLKLTANCGYAVSAKKIWWRYAGDVKDGVVGHAGSMVRLVSLFSSLAGKVDLREASRCKDGENGMLSDRNDQGVEGVETGESSEQFMQFAELIISKFRDTKEPLEEASHQDLNALVRAYFMIGQIVTGFDIFQIVMDKKEIPDLHDVNVALSGMAKYSPRVAGKMIERMIEKGLLPDAITFGTVIQEAILRGDTELMVDLVRRAREVDEGSLTFKTIAALVRASVCDGDGDDEHQAISLPMGQDGKEGQLILGGNNFERVESNLKTAWELIQTFKAENAVGIPNLGENCLRGALRIGQPDLAFKFWNSFLRKRTQWNDPEQVSLRRQVAKLVQTSRNEGRLDGNKARVMLGQLDASHLGVR